MDVGRLLRQVMHWEANTRKQRQRRPWQNWTDS